jgi:hypothetical protein
MITLQQFEEWDAEDREAEDDLLVLEAKRSASLISIDFEKVRSMSPSQLLQVMLDGLAENSADPLFRVKMETFADVASNGVCFGCAATCAIAKLHGPLYSQTMAEARTLGVEAVGYRHFAYILGKESLRKDIRDLEWAIDEARSGDLGELFEFCGIDPDEADSRFNGRYRLMTSNWQEQIPAVEATIAALKEAGY